MNEFGAGGNSFEDNYRRVQSIAGNAPENSQDASNQVSSANPAEGMREMNDGERFFASLANIGRGMASSSGFDQYYQSHGGLPSLLSPEGALRFAVNLPSGMASALPTGAANLYAAATGSDVTYGSDVKNNMIREEKLDPWQRAASAVTGGIDTIGLALGGSGSVVNELGRAVKAGRGVQAAANTGAGLRGLGFSGSGFANRGTMTTGQAIAFDTVEEAGEEVVQSISEDVIQDQLDQGSFGRAIEAGILGGLGGAMMSGGAMALRSATNSDIARARADQSSGAEDDHNPFSALLGLANSNRDPGTIFASDDAKKLREERMLGKWTDRIPGSVMATLINSGTIATIDDVIPGIEEIKTIWKQGIESENDLLAFFNGGASHVKSFEDGTGDYVNRDALAQILLSDGDQEAAVTQLNNLLDTAYGVNGPRRVVALRNPSTMNGAVYLNVRSISTGSGIDMSGNTAMLIGGDFDGDRAALMFGRRNNDYSPVVWASQAIRRNEAGNGYKNAPSIADWVYGSASYVPGAKAQQEISNKVYGAIKGSAKAIGFTDEEAKKHAKRLSKILMKAYKTTGKTRNNAITDALLEVERELGLLYQEKNPDKDSSNFQRIGINNIVAAFAATRMTPQQLATSAANKAIEYLQDMLKSSETGSMFDTTPGATGSYGTAASGYQVGIPGYFTAKDYDQFYRNYATQVYTYVKEHKTEIIGQEGEKDVMSAYGKLVQASCHVINQGMTPIKSITGIVDNLIKLRFYDYLGRDPEADAQFTPGQTKSVIDSFIHAYNDFSDMFNKCRKVIVDSHLVESYMAPRRGTIDLSKDGGGITFGSEFTRMFALEPICKFIPKEVLPDGIDPMMTVADAILVASRRDLKISSDFIDGSDSSGNLLGMCVSAQRSEGSRAQTLAINAYNEFRESLSNIRARIRANGGKVDPRDIESLRAFTNWVYSVLNVEAAVDAKFLDPERWAGTKIGEMILSGDTKQFLNACTIINFGGKFMKYLEYLATTEVEGKAFDAQMEDELTALASIDAIHAEIVNELRTRDEDGNPVRCAILEMIIDDAVQFDQKQETLEKFFSGIDNSVKNNLYLSSVMGKPDTSSCLTDTSIMTKIRKGQSYISTYKKTLYESNMNEVAEIKKLFSTPNINPGVSFSDIMNTVLRRKLFNINMNGLSVLMADMANVTNRQPEKGSANDMAGSFFVMMSVASNGKQISADSNTFNTPFGNYMAVDLAQNLDLLCSILANPEFSIEVFDETTGEPSKFSRDKLFSEVSPTYRASANKEVTDQVWFDLFEAVPSLVSYFGGVNMSFTTSQGGLTQTLSKARTFLDYCTEYIRDDAMAGYRDAATKKFYETADEITVALLGDLRTYKYIFASMTADQKALAMSGKQPDPDVIWANMQKLSRGILALKMKTKDGVASSTNSFLTDLMSTLGKSIRIRLDSVYDTILFDNTVNLNSSIGGASALIDSFMGEALLMSFVSAGNSIDYEFNGQTKTFDITTDMRSAYSNKFEGRLSGYVNNAVAGLSDSLNEIMSLCYAVKASLNITSDTKEKFINGTVTALSSLASSHGLMQDEATAIATAIWDKYESINGDTLSTMGSLVGGQIGKTLMLPSDPIFGGKIDQKGFLDKLEALGDLIHDDRFSKYVADRRKLLNGDTVDNPYDFHQAEDLFELYKKLFDKDGNWVGPADGTVHFVNLEKLIIRYTDYILSYSIQKHSMSGGAINPHEISDRFDFISMFDDFIRSNEIDEIYQKYGKIDQSLLNLDKYINDIDVPQVRTREESAYMNQFVEAVSAGRVISEVGINGSEVMKTAAISFVPEDRQLPFVVDNKKTKADIEALIASGDITNEYHVIDQNGEMHTIRDITLQDGVDYQLLTNVVNPHGIYYGPQPEPTANGYGAKYQTTLGALNRFHMAAMEELVLKVRKAFGEDSAQYIKHHASSFISKAKFESQAELVSEGRKSYEEFVETAAKRILEESGLAEDLAKIGIEVPQIMSFVQMMTVGYAVSYTTTDVHGNTVAGRAVVDIQHFYTGDVEDRLSEIVGKNVTFSSAELLVVPLQAVSTRIAKKVFSNSQQPEKKRKDPHDIAFEAMTNWDDYSLDTSSATDIVRSFSPLGRSHTYVEAERSMTPQQNLFDTVFGIDRKKGKLTYENPWSYATKVVHVIGTDKAAPTLSTSMNLLNTSNQVVIANVYGLTNNDRNNFNIDVSATPGRFESVRKQLMSFENHGHSQYDVYQTKDGQTVDSVVLCFNTNPTSDDFRDAAMFALQTGATLLVPANKSFQGPRGIATPIGPKYQLQLDQGASIGLAELNLSPYARDPRALYDLQVARRRDVNPGIRNLVLMLDERARYATLGDGSIIIAKKAVKRFGVKSPTRTKDIDLRALVDGYDGAAYRFENLSDSDVAAILNMDPADPDAWSSFGNSIKKIANPNYGLGFLDNGDRYIRGEIVNYISSVVNAKERVETMPLSGMHGGNCVGIVKAVSTCSNKVQYVPIFAPASIGTISSGAVARPDGSAMATISYSETVNFDKPDMRVSFKTSGSSRAADKGFATVREDEIFHGIVDAVENYETVSGRMKGRDEVILYTNLSNYMNMNYFNMFWEKKVASDGSVYYDFTDRFKQFFLKHKEMLGPTRQGTIDGDETSFWDLLLKDDPEAWGLMDISGSGVSDEISTRNNIKKAILAAQKYFIPVSQLFGVSSYDYKPVTNPDGSEDLRLTDIYEVQNIPDIDLVFSGWAWNDICDFYQIVGRNFNLMASTNAQTGNTTTFDRDGRMFIDDEIGYSKVIIDDFAYLGHELESETAGNAASIGVQQRINKLMMYGAPSSSIDFVDTLASFIAGDASTYSNFSEYHFDSLAKASSAAMGGPLLKNYAEYEKDQELEQMIRDETTFRRNVIGRDGKPINFENLGSTQEGRAIQDAITELEAALQVSHIPLNAVHTIVNHIDGSTKGDFQNGTIYASTFASHISLAATYLNSTGLLVTAGKVGTRYHVPAFQPSFIKYICSISNNKDMTYDNYVKKMWEEEKKALDMVQLIPDKEEAQRVELQNFFAAMRKSYRDNEAHPWREAGFVFGGLTVQKMAKDNSIIRSIAEKFGFETGAFDELAKLGTRLMQDQTKLMAKGNSQKLIKSDTSYSGKAHQDSVSVEGFVSNNLDNVVTFSRGMAVLNIGVVAGNSVGRGVSQSFMDLLLDLGSTGIGPFAGKSSVSSRTIDLACNDQNMFDAYMAIREMGVTGDEAIVQGAKNTSELVENIAKARAGRSSFDKTATKLFTLANGGNFAMRQQMRIFWKRLPQFIEADPRLSSYLEKVSDNETFLDREIQKDPAGFFISCFVQGGQNSRPELYMAAVQAMNSAMTGDMAQRHWLATFLHHALKDHPLGRFIFSTTICKFPRYQFNLVDKALNWFAPMSTLNFILTHAAQEWDERRAQEAEAKGEEYTRWGFQLDQRFVNAREAILYDCAHLGPMVVAAVLLHVGNAIEPPDDEKKWGDPDEWLICGYRLGESWWLGDLLGAFLPSILYTQSCMLGKPTSSLIVNGSLSACYGNPFLRAADVCDVLTNWDSDGDLGSYVSAVEQYQDAEGGAPGFLDWISANSVSTAANLITSTVTPSFIREIYRNSQEYEKSYKKVYKKTPTGKLSEEGMAGETQNTTYFDAQIRKACRNNPFLAVVMDVLHHGEGTGYWLSEMPDTIYFDESQIDAAKYWSIDGLDEVTAEEKLSMIMLKIQSEDLDTLKNSGFYLDPKTLYALGSYIWDAYYDIEREWEKLGESGALSYTVLGNGNFDDGKARYYELLALKNAQKDSLRDLYNKKIKGSYLNQGYQQYRRYATSYRTDSEGDIYATGFHRQGALPFVSAPGTTSNPEGTAGYENDFMSLSAVTGQPMSQRALVPIPTESADLPPFSGFSENGDGEGYSGKWTRYLSSSGNASGGTKSADGLTYPDGTPVPEGVTPESGTKSSGSGYRSGGGSGYSRRSSGGGSYVPSISSRNYTPNVPNAVTSRSTYTGDAQFDYLRPSVSTKGSRDAYKRGDI